MSLSVKVIRYKRQPPVSPMAMSFAREGGTIGRLPEPENTFHLPDPDKYISRKHAVIRYENGFYYLTDTSTAGTFFTNKNMKVHRDASQLSDGDRLRIGDYAVLIHWMDDAMLVDDITNLLYDKGRPLFGTPNRYRLILRNKDAAFFQN